MLEQMLAMTEVLKLETRYVASGTSLTVMLPTKQSLL